MPRDGFAAVIFSAMVLGGCSSMASEMLTPATNAAVLFNNTLRVTNSVGSIDIFVNEAGDYRQVNFKGGAATGRWRFDGDRLCLTQLVPEPPADLKRENCTALRGSRVGDRWESPTDRGGVVTISIAAGRDAMTRS